MNTSVGQGESNMSWRWSMVWSDERGGWWRVPLTLVLYVIGVVLGMALYTQANISGLKAAMGSHPAHVQEIVPLVATLLITGLGLGGCLIGVRFVHHKPIARLFTDGRPFGVGLALISAALWAGLWLAWTVMLPGAWEGMKKRAGEIPLVWWPVVIVACIGAMTMGRTAEEVLFRGYLQTRMAAWIKRPWVAVGVVAIIFNVMHRGNAAAHTAITLFGIVWGAACIRAGTLAPAIGAHVVHDTLEVLLRPSGHSKDVNATTTWVEVVLISVALAVWFVWLIWATRNKPTDSTSHPLPETVAASGG